MNKVRAQLTAIRHFDEGHATVASFAPLICFAATLTVLVLLRLVNVFGAVTARCVATDEFWYTSTGGNWPLVGTVTLVLLLLLGWNVIIGLDEWKQSRGTRIVIVANTIGIAAMFFLLPAVYDSATFAHDSRAGVYDNVRFRPFVMPLLETESECATMRRFAGRWRVVDRQIGYGGFDIPAQWIELKPWGYVYAQDTSWSQPYADRWSPPFRTRHSMDNRWLYGDLFNAPWDFELRGDTLTLSTSEPFGLGRQQSTVILQREPDPGKPVFPNPHAVLSEQGPSASRFW